MNMLKPLHTSFDISYNFFFFLCFKKKKAEKKVTVRRANFETHIRHVLHNYKLENNKKKNPKLFYRG